MGENKALDQALYLLPVPLSKESAYHQLCLLPGSGPGVWLPCSASDVRQHLGLLWDGCGSQEESRRADFLEEQWRCRDCPQVQGCQGVMDGEVVVQLGWVCCSPEAGSHSPVSVLAELAPELAFRAGEPGIHAALCGAAEDTRSGSVMTPMASMALQQ